MGNHKPCGDTSIMSGTNSKSNTNHRLGPGNLDDLANLTSKNPLDSFSKIKVAGTSPQVIAAPSTASIEESSQETSPDSRSVLQQLQRHRQPISSSLISFLFHVLILIAFAIWWIRTPGENGFESEFEFVANESAIDAGPANQPQVQIDLPDQSRTPLENQATAIDHTASELMGPTTLTVPNTVTSPTEAIQPTPAVNSTPRGSLHPAGGSVKGREGEMRAQLAANRGGSQASENAVEKGLKWLAKHQQPDGGWSLQFDHPQCQGKCANGGSIESRVAATGLALMAFLGAGYTHEEGRYQTEVDRGLVFLIKTIRYNTHGGNLTAGVPTETRMYSQAIGTIALCEALAMTGDDDLHFPASECKRYIENAQHKAGGWRYTPGEPGDMTVTGWQLMALKSAEMAGLDVSKPVLQKADNFLTTLETSGGSQYGYLTSGRDPAPSAVGLLARMYRGWNRFHGALEQGAALLAKDGPSSTDIYFNYYATLVLHHVRGEEWENWNSQMRDYLVQTQEINGHQAGSWFCPDKHSNVGGRLYVTCMAIMTLEVYYRYLPLYGWPEDWAE